MKTDNQRVRQYLMQGMSGGLSGLVLLIFLVSIIAGWWWFSHKNTVVPIRIGLAINLSGQGGTANEYVREGAILAVEEVNRQDGINGRALELVVKDDQNTPAGIVAADRALIAQDVIAIIGHVTSQNTLISYPFVTSSGVLLFNPYTATTKLVGKDDLLIRTNVGNHQNGLRMAKLLREKGADVTAFLMDMSNQSYVHDLYKHTLQHYPGKDIAVPFKRNALPSWETLINQLLSPKPDAIVLLTEVSMTGLIAQKLRGNGYMGPLIATLWAQSPDLTRYGGSAVEGLTIVSYMDPDNQHPEFQAFTEKMQKRLGRPPNARSTRAYEAVHILATALKRCKTLTSEELRQQILNHTFNSLMGAVHFDAYGDVERPIYEIQVRNGRFARLRQLD